MKKLLLIDGNSLSNRAYHAFQKVHQNKEGVYMNAVWGMGKFLKNLKARYQPDVTIVAFDGAYNFRELSYPSYKGTRGEKDDDFVRQLPYIKELCLLMECNTIQQDGFEADDLIGILVHRAVNLGVYGEVRIVSSDRDLLQLTEFDNVSLEIPVKGVSEITSVAKHNCKDFYGVEAKHVALYKALSGDTSDNIKGVKGVGDKTAKLLIETFHGAEHFMGFNWIREEDLEPDVLKAIVKVAQNQKDFFESLHLATILTDVKVNIMSFMRPVPQNAQELKKAFMLENGLTKQNHG